MVEVDVSAEQRAERHAGGGERKRVAREIEASTLETGEGSDIVIACRNARSVAGDARPSAFVR